MKLLGKLFINGKIKALTGLHIGGSKTDVAIGDIDNSVIKTSEGVPYIPGSSLKGKIRSLLEKKEGRGLCTCGNEKNDCKICVIFGTAADKRGEETGPTRLIVRDCHLTGETRHKMESKEGEFRELDLIYTESKWENLRQNNLPSTTSTANRKSTQGAEFDCQMVFNLMEKEDAERFGYLVSGMFLLEDDYLRSGSRGYGRIEFRDLEISIKTIRIMKELMKQNRYIQELERLDKDEFKEKLQTMLEAE